MLGIRTVKISIATLHTTLPKFNQTIYGLTGAASKITDHKVVR